VKRTVTVTCACNRLVFLKRKRTPRRNVVLFGAVCESCGRGMDLWIEKQPANEASR
jgi:hypothetical protein